MLKKKYFLVIYRRSNEETKKTNNDDWKMLCLFLSMIFVSCDTQNYLNRKRKKKSKNIKKIFL